MFIRSIIYISIGIALVVVNAALNSAFEWKVDIVWLLMVAAAFTSWPALAPVIGFAFGLMIDGLSGSMGFYALSYGSFGMVLALIRRVFYLGGLIPGWIVAIIGAQLFWMFLWAFSRGIIMLGSVGVPPEIVSPFILSSFIGYPLVWFLAGKILAAPKEARRRYYNAPKVRIIDST